MDVADSSLVPTTKLHIIDKSTINMIFWYGA